MDEATTVEVLKEAVRGFVDARDWGRYHSPKNLAMSISIEAAELMEHFQWLTVEAARVEVENPEKRAEIAAELADVVIYCLSFANRTGIDVSQAVTEKLTHNETRFPVGRIRGFGVEDS